MKVNIPDQYVPLVVKGLDHYFAYTRAVKRDDPRYREAADWFQAQLTAKSAAGSDSGAARNIPQARRRRSVG